MKRGSIEISFGMIFSIIIIIALIGVAVYAITNFLGFSRSAEAGLFYEKFQSSVDDIWSSSITNRVISFSLPSNINFVCFGSIADNGYSGRYVSIFSNLRQASSGFQQQNSNVFLYPAERAKEFAFKKIDHIDTSSLGFDCFEVKSGKVNIRLSKGEFESLVKVEHE